MSSKCSLAFCFWLKLSFNVADFLTLELLKNLQNLRVAQHHQMSVSLRRIIILITTSLNAHITFDFESFH